MEKVLSIIIPSYNMERYISHCIESLLVPNLDKVEVLVINDGSKDRTLEIARGYESRYPGSIRVIDKPNGNYGSCVNRGLKEATGRYVKVLDADDSFDTANFSDYIEFLDHNDFDLIITDYVKVDEDDVVTSTHRLPINITQGESRPLAGLFDRLHREFQMHFVTYKTANIRQIGYVQTEGISFTDQEWIFLPVATADKVGYFHSVVYRYLVGRAGQTVGDSATKRILPLAKIARNQITQYSRVAPSLSAEKVDYLRRRLSFNLDYLFRMGMLYNVDESANAELSSLDRFIQSAGPEFLEIVDSLEIHPRCPIHYVRYWRSRGYDAEAFVLRVIREALRKYQASKK